MKFNPLLMFMILITGCAPLSQAPLVYSSKQTLGVDIILPNPETPTAELNVGFKNKDIAIVPVAVAKLPTDKGISSNEIQLIRATYSGSVNPGELQEAQHNLILLKKERDSKKTILETAQKKNEKLNDLYNKYQALKGQIETLKRDITTFNNAQDTTKETEAKNSLNTKQADLSTSIAELESSFKIAPDGVENLKKTIEQEVNDASKEKTDADNHVKVAEKKLEEIEGKSDAYSVFGSFDSVTSLSKSTDASAGVTLGKMFSTGVAAQNVSEGIKESSIYLAKAKCAQKLKELFSTITPEQAASVCGTK